MTRPLLLKQICWNVALMLALCACGLGRPASTATPTPTYIIVGEEGTAAAPQATALVETPGLYGCLEHPSGEAMQGPPCLLGAYEAHYDVTTQIDEHQTAHVVSPLTAMFSIWAVGEGKLQGTAHLTYSVNGTYKDTQSTSCPVQTEVVEPFGWDVQLTGKYSKPPEGGVQITLQADPVQGPEYTAKFTDCPIPDRQEPGVQWSAFSGRLVNGVYDSRQDQALPADSTGEIYSLVHVEAAQNP